MNGGSSAVTHPSVPGKLAGNVGPNQLEYPICLNYLENTMKPFKTSRNRILRQVAVTLAVATAISFITISPFSGYGLAAENMKDSMKGEGGSMASMEMHKSMMGGMKEMESMPMTGDADHDFAMMMKQHHQSAIDMARTELQHGKDPKIKAMAKKIISSQQKEIKEFDQWLSRHKAGAESMHK